MSNVPPSNVNPKTWVWTMLSLIPVGLTLVTVLSASGVQKLWALIPGAIAFWMWSVALRAIREWYPPTDDGPEVDA